MAETITRIVTLTNADIDLIARLKAAVARNGGYGKRCLVCGHADHGTCQACPSTYAIERLISLVEVK